MRLNERDVAVTLTAEGREVLRRAGWLLSGEAPLVARIEEAEDLGLWMRLEGRGEDRRILLIRWEYVEAVEILAGPPRAVGLR